MLNITAQYKAQLSNEELHNLMSMNCVDHAVYDMKRDIPIIMRCNSPVWPMRLTQSRVCVDKCELFCTLNGDTVNIIIGTDTETFTVVTLPLNEFIRFADEAIGTPNVIICYDDNSLLSSSLPRKLSLRK